MKLVASHHLVHQLARKLPGAAKPAIRGLIRRTAVAAGVLAPPAELGPELAATSSPILHLGLPDFNHYLHFLRTAELVRLPRAERCLLSAGPSSAEYFEWIESNSGAVPLHIGVEAYRPEPPGLPANVRWVCNTVGDLSDIETSSCDVMYSGQNFEHLWPAEVVGSLLEARRVLGPGGYLVMDSPNRIIAHAYNWSQPEHTVEFSPDEAVHLLELAGFDVVEVRGVHLCRDPRNLELLPFDPLADDPPRFLERVQLAADFPDLSFVWWITSRRSEREAQPLELAAEAHRLFEVNWPERLRRVSVPPAVHLNDDDIFEVPAEFVGYARFGPYCPLPPGNHSAQFDVRVSDSTVELEFDVSAENGSIVLASTRVKVPPSLEWQSFTLSVHCDRTYFAVECRVRSWSGGAFEMRVGAQLALQGA